MEPTRFDELTKVLATPTSRRQALKAIAATALGGLFVRLDSGIALASISACAHFCAATFGPATPAASQCTSDAAHHKGLCYTCGPASPGGTQPICCTTNASGFCSSYSSATCCSSSGQCCNGSTCVATCSGTGCNECGSVLLSNGTCAKPCNDNTNCEGGFCLPETNGSGSFCSNFRSLDVCPTGTGCPAGTFCNSVDCVQATC